MNTKELLDQIVKINGLTDTHYGLWKHMQKYGWSESSCRNYRKGSTLPDDKQALDIAKELKMKPEAVIAIIHAERATDDNVKAVWERMAKRVAVASGAAILTAGMMAAPTTDAAASVIDAPAMYIMSTCALLLAALWSRRTAPQLLAC